MCLAHLHPKANICAKFHENWWKTEEVVRDARFSPHFCHSMPLPWQHTFCHCQKNVSCTSTPKANICAKFHENWWKTEEVVCDARFPPPPPIFAICRYHGNTLSATVKKNVSCTSTPQGKHLCQISWELVNKNINDVALIRHLATSNIANFMWNNFLLVKK